MKISACYIVKNEAALLKRSIESIKESVDEIVVVDTGSSDETKEVAKKLGASVYDFQWQDDFSVARNEAIEKANGDFIIFLDADEYVSEETKGNLRRIILASKEYDEIYLKLVNIEQESKEVLDDFFAVRIFKRKPTLRYIGKIHEGLKDSSDGPVKERFISSKDILVYHTGYSKEISYEKAKRNYQMLKKELAEGNENEFFYMYLAEAARGLGLTEEAKKWARLDIAAGRKRTSYASRSYRLLLEILFKEKASIQERLELAKMAIKDFPELPEFHAEVAELLGASFDYKGALDFMDRAIRLLNVPEGIEPTLFTKKDEEKVKKRIQLWQRILEFSKDIKITACVIAKNDEADAKRWIESAKVYADEIIYVNTGATDKTPLILKNGGAKCYDFLWQDDFAAAKNFALEKANGEYITFLDIDEYFAEPEKVRYFLAWKKYNNEKTDAFFLPMINIDLDDSNKEIDRFSALRIFRRSKDLCYAGKIHEQLIKKEGSLDVDYETGNLFIYHVGYSSSRIKEKLKRNLRLIEKEGKKVGQGYYRYLAECYFGLGRFEEAFKTAFLGIQAGSMETECYYVALQSMEILRRPKEEIKELIELGLALFPNVADFWARRGFLFITEEFYQEGKEYLEKSLELFKGETGNEHSSRYQSFLDRVYYQLAFLYWREGKGEKAQDLVKKVLSLNKYYEDALSLLYKIKKPVSFSKWQEEIGWLYTGEKDKDFLLAWAEKAGFFVLAKDMRNFLVREKDEIMVNIQRLYDDKNYSELYKKTLIQATWDMSAVFAFLLALIHEENSSKKDFCHRMLECLPLSIKKVFGSYEEGKPLADDVHSVYLGLVPAVILLCEEEVVIKYLSMAYENDELCVKTAEQLIEKKKWEKALLLLGRISVESPCVNAEFWYMVGIVFYYLKDFEKAQEAFLRAKNEGAENKDIDAYLEWMTR